MPAYAGGGASIIAALSLFIVGSMLCALAPNMPVLILARGLQGLGGGGKHQYQLSATQARDVIDAIRAAGVKRVNISLDTLDRDRFARLARRDSLPQVLEGIAAGERVVTKGAYLIRLSTMSSAVPAHGHVH